MSSEGRKCRDGRLEAIFRDERLKMKIGGGILKNGAQKSSMRFEFGVAYTIRFSARCGRFEVGFDLKLAAIYLASL